MDRSEALRRLNDPDSDLRLRAARALSSLGRSEDEEVLRRRRRVESVPWVRSALERALERTSGGATSPVHDDVLDAGGMDHNAAQYMAGVQLATDRIVHELRSIVGTLRYWAEKEHGQYAGSQTERQVERLRRCLEAIDFLGKMARPPAFEEFDLTELVDEEAAPIAADVASLDRVGRRPFVVQGDRGILGLVLRNALYNAAEAQSSAPASVYVNWGETPGGYWLAVFDRGPGLPQEPEALFDFGASTKQGHVGAGLAIVAHAAVAVGGEVSLSEEADGTTKLEFRWPRGVEPSGANPSH